jgi:dihydroorotase-like cyclic amidohydrolase
METGTAAAAAGGSTTVVDMPLNSHPCTTTAQLLQEKMKIAEVRRNAQQLLFPASRHQHGQFIDSLQQQH